MVKGITRAEILVKIPKLKPGSFSFFCARAGVAWIDKQPSKKTAHLMEYYYPADSVARLKSVMADGAKFRDRK